MRELTRRWRPAAISCALASVALGAASCSANEPSHPALPALVSAGDAAPAPAKANANNAAMPGDAATSDVAGHRATPDGGNVRDPSLGAPASGASGNAAADSDNDAGTAVSPPTLQPTDPPVADDCITDVSAGDHSFTCSGLTFLVLVDPMCIHNACGLIFDIHGATMSGAQMRDNTLLYKIAPSQGYIVVNPSATASNTGGTWDLTNDPPKVSDFMDRMINAFHVDPDRIHVGGFSQGSIMTFWFLCNRKDILASAAPVSGATDVKCLDDGWQPRVPIFYENGTKDMASTIDSAHTMVDSIVKQLALTGGMEIAGDGHYSRKHWEGSGGMLFDYIEHDYGGQAVLDGHCIPGGVDTPTMGKNNFSLNATTCTTGDIKINWGELALKWYVDHPRIH